MLGTAVGLEWLPGTTTTVARLQCEAWILEVIGDVIMGFCPQDLWALMYILSFQKNVK